MKTKQCTKCKVVKSLADFHKCKRNKGGRHRLCKTCKSEYYIEYYARLENKKRAAEYNARPENKKRRAEYGAMLGDTFIKNTLGSNDPELIKSKRKQILKHRELLKVKPKTALDKNKLAAAKGLNGVISKIIKLEVEELQFKKYKSKKVA